MRFRTKILLGLVFIIAVIALLGFVNSTLWVGVVPTGFIDSFDRANNEDLGSDWNDDANTEELNASITDNFLKIEDRDVGDQVDFEANNVPANVNGTHRFFEFRVNSTGTIAAIGVTQNIVLRNENLAITFRFRINDTDMDVVGGTVLDGTENFSIDRDIFYNVSFDINWSHNRTQWSVDDVPIGNITFNINSTRAGQIVISSGGPGTVGNMTFDYIQWGQESIFSIINLLLPTDNSITHSDRVPFSCNIASDSFNFVNMSLHIDGVRNFTNSSSGFQNLTITKDVSTLGLGTHTWTCIAYNASDSFTSNNNFTFFINHTVENSQTFNATTSEGATEGFVLNISWNNFTYTNIQSSLFYNNTEFTGLKSGNGDEAIFTRSIDIPSIDIQTNFTFYWQTTLTNSTNTVKVNSTVNTQIVNLLSLDDCSSNTILFFNYTLKDEENEVVFNSTFANRTNSTVEVDIKIYPVGSRVPIINFSQNYSENGNPQVCLSSDLGGATYDIDVQTFYDADGFAAEFHNIRNATLTNSSLPQNVDLLDLKDADSTEFLITFKGENFLPIKNALINIQRKYVSQGTFKSVESPLTDQDGQAVGHFDTDGVVYTITVTKDKQTIAIFDNVAVVCQAQVVEDCKINLKAAASIASLKKLEDFGNISITTYTFDIETRTITLTYNTNDGLSRTVLLNATKYDRFGNQTVCDDSLTSSAGTLTCVIPESFGNITIVSQLFVDGELIDQRVFSISPDPYAQFGQSTTGALVLIMMLIIPLMFVTSGIGLIIGTLFGLAMASFLLLFKSSSALSVASSIFWIAIAGGIIIYKISRRDKE